MQRHDTVLTVMPIELSQAELARSIEAQRARRDRVSSATAKLALIESVRDSTHFSMGSHAASRTAVIADQPELRHELLLSDNSKKDDTCISDRQLDVVMMTEQELVSRFQPYVRAIARQMPAHALCAFEDFVQVGLLAMIKSARKFRPEEGTGFLTYCHQRIKGAMIDEPRGLDEGPRNDRRRASEYFDEADRLSQALQSTPTQRQIIDSLAERYGTPEALRHIGSLARA